MSFIPHLSLALNLALLVIVVLDVFNPLLGLLKGTVFLVFIALDILCSVLTALRLIRKQRK